MWKKLRKSTWSYNLELEDYFDIHHIFWSKIKKNTLDFETLLQSVFIGVRRAISAPGYNIHVLKKKLILSHVTVAESEKYVFVHYTCWFLNRLF